MDPLFMFWCFLCSGTAAGGKTENRPLSYLTLILTTTVRVAGI